MVISDRDIAEIVRLTEGYSASDLTALCRESAMGPIREMRPDMLRTVKAEDVRPVSRKVSRNFISCLMLMITFLCADVGFCGCLVDDQTERIGR
jgi:SpoVK/Ycf46/Vps4 family AAA+-type ATPase